MSVPSSRQMLRYFSSFIFFRVFFKCRNTWTWVFRVNSFDAILIIKVCLFSYFIISILYAETVLINEKKKKDGVERASRSVELSFYPPTRTRSLRAGIYIYISVHIQRSRHTSRWSVVVSPSSRTRWQHNESVGVRQRVGKKRKASRKLVFC